MNLADVVTSLRALGVRRLTLELGEPVARETETPPAPEPAETKLPTQCKAPGCGEEKQGLFGGSVGGDFCRAHAAGRLGART